MIAISLVECGQPSMDACWHGPVCKSMGCSEQQRRAGDRDALAVAERCLQVHDKRAAMAAALEDPDNVDMDDDAMSSVSTAVTGLSAYTQRTHGPSASSTSGAGASTVGGKLPQGHKHKVHLPSHALVLCLHPAVDSQQRCRTLDLPCMACASQQTRLKALG